MIVSDQGICKDCKRYMSFNVTDGSGVCSKIYGSADYPEGLQFDKTDDEIITACPHYKQCQKGGAKNGKRSIT